MACHIGLKRATLLVGLFIVLMTKSAESVRCNGTNEDVCFKGAGGSDVGRLVNDLFEVYGPGYVRPTRIHTDVTRVEYRLKIHELIDLSAVGQQISINAFLRMSWVDEFLQWDPSEYGGVNEIFVPTGSIWQPDITLVGNVNPSFEVMKGTFANVESNGMITWLTPSFFTSSCTVHIKYFPFDTQHCRFTFTSWSYNVEKLDLMVATGEDSKQTSYVENGVWVFKNATTSREIVDYGDVGEYSEISYDFVFQRRSRYYSLNIIAPFVFLSLLSVMVFFLPPDGRDAKVCLAITDLLGLVVFLQIVGGALPPTGETPIIATYFLAMVIMVCISIIIMIVVFYMQSNTFPPPRWFKRFVLSFMAKCVFLYDQEVAEAGGNDNDSETKMADLNLNEVSASVPSSQEAEAGVKVPQSLVDDVAYLRKTVEAQGMDDQISSQWMHASRVIDRWLLIIAITVWIVATIALLVQSNGDDGEAV